MIRFRNISIILLAASTAFYSCNVNEPVPSRDEERSDAVNLVCAFQRPKIDLETKATADYKGLLESTTTIPDDKDLEVGLVRVDRKLTDYLKYSGAPAYGLSFKAGMKGLDQVPEEYDYSDAPYYYFTKGELEGSHTAGYRKIKNFTNAQYFKTNTDVVQYISWYPYGEVNGNADDAHKDDPFTITESLDLKTDVLYSDVVRESMNKQFKDTLVYHHALCQFRIFVYRMINLKEIKDKDGKVIQKVDDNIWGKLQDVYVKNECESMTIQLPNTMAYDYSSDISYSLKNQLPNARIDNGVYSFPDGNNGVFYVTEETAVADTSTATGVILPTGLEQRKLVATYLAAPPEDGLLQLDVKASAAESEKTITIANEFKAGYAYDVVLCFSDHGVINAEVSIEKWDNAVKIETDVAAEMYYDLSRYGTANSYIVSSSNLGYSFNGLTKGCGNTLNGGSIVGMDDCSLPLDSYVDLIYCEPEGLLELQSHRLIDRAVLFYVPGYDESENPNPGKPDYRLKQKGNAIIAVRTSQGGDILWSWHIWVTDRPHDIGNNNGYSIMDRNLGALEAPRTLDAIGAVENMDDPSDTWDPLHYGFYYQWGRKDPMIPGWTITKTDIVSIEDGILHPNNFYGYTYPTRGYDWISESENTDVDKKALWGYRPNRDYVKTVYDPCPPGYRVPEMRCWTQTTGNIWSNFHRDDLQAVDNPKYGLYNINGLWNWYPAAGWIDSDDQPQTVDSPIVVNHAWTSGHHYDDAYVYVAEQHYNVDVPDKFGGNVFNGASSSQYVYRLNNADACPVRCISTAAEEIVLNLSKAQTSNCYIVPEAGTYMFKADVKGNGTSKVTTSAGTFNVYDGSVNIDHSQINHVAVLWWQGDLSGKTGNDSNSAGTKCPIKFVRADGDVLPKSPARNGTDFKDDDLAVVDADGYVRFTIDEEQYCHGNAILAAFDKNNKVLWSWHLWLTENPKKVKLGPRTVDNHTYVYYSMDRNLGATYCPTESEITGRSFGDNNNAAKRLGTIGFYYQWGRKDPIQGPPAYNSGTGTNNSSTWYLRDVNNGYSWTTRTTIQTHAAVATRDEHVQYPDYFLYSTATSGRMLWNTTNWGSSGNTYNQYTASWGYPSGTTGATYDPRMTKTINDPCPPGYYMPPHYFFAAAYFANSGNDGNGRSHNYESGDTNGLFAQTSGDQDFVIGAPMWFPFGGYREYGTGNLNSVGSGGAYHSGLDWGSNNVRIFRLQANGGGQYELPPATGATVRCRAY